MQRLLGWRGKISRHHARRARRQLASLFRNERIIINIEIFLAFLAAMVAYRVLSPLIDAMNPLTIFARRKAVRRDSMRDVYGRMSQEEVAQMMSGAKVVFSPQD